eukprot:m.379188 g.379188  ORF g.379188 m.379188 type:complete len:85 (+) comp97166_c0_seq1:77-331(+)
MAHIRMRMFVYVGVSVDDTIVLHRYSVHISLLNHLMYSPVRLRFFLLFFFLFLLLPLSPFLVDCLVLLTLVCFDIGFCFVCLLS